MMMIIIVLIIAVVLFVLTIFCLGESIIKQSAGCIFILFSMATMFVAGDLIEREFSRGRPIESRMNSLDFKYPHRVMNVFKNPEGGYITTLYTTNSFHDSKGKGQIKIYEIPEELSVGSWYITTLPQKTLKRVE